MTSDYIIRDREHRETETSVLIDHIVEKLELEGYTNLRRFRTDLVCDGTVHGKSIQIVVKVL